MANKGPQVFAFNGLARIGSLLVITGLSLILSTNTEIAPKMYTLQIYNILVKYSIALAIIVMNFLASFLVVVDSIKRANILLLSWPMICGIALMLIFIYDLFHVGLLALLGVLTIAQALLAIGVNILLTALHLYFYNTLITVFETFSCQYGYNVNEKNQNFNMESTSHLR